MHERYLIFRWRLRNQMFWGKCDMFLFYDKSKYLNIIQCQQKHYQHVSHPSLNSVLFRENIFWFYYKRSKLRNVCVYINSNNNLVIVFTVKKECRLKNFFFHPLHRVTHVLRCTNVCNRILLLLEWWWQFRHLEEQLGALFLLPLSKKYQYSDPLCRSTDFYNDGWQRSW